MNLLEALGFTPGGPEDERRRAELMRAFEAIREAERAIWRLPADRPGAVMDRERDNTGHANPRTNQRMDLP